MIETGIVGETSVVAVVVVAGVAVVVADEASSSEAGNSLMDVVVELALVVLVAAAADLCVVYRRQDNFGSWRVDIEDSRTWVAAFAALAGRKVARLDHGFERMLPKLGSWTEVCDKRIGTGAASG